MALRKLLLAVGVCALLVPYASSAETRLRILRVVVQTAEGIRLADVDVRVVGVGGKPTSETGEFVFTLPGEFEPGSEIEFFVAGWNITNLDSGKTYVPKSETAVIHIKVSRLPSSQRDVLSALRTKKDRAGGPLR